jgi:hypothetical protein
VEIFTNKLKEEKISMDELKLLEELLYSKHYENKGKFYYESKKYVKEANWNEQFEVYNFVVKNLKFLKLLKRSDLTSFHLKMLQHFGEIGGFLYLFEYFKKIVDLNLIRQMLRIFVIFVKILNLDSNVTWN